MNIACIIINIISFPSIVTWVWWSVLINNFIQVLCSINFRLSFRFCFPNQLLILHYKANGIVHLLKCQIACELDEKGYVDNVSKPNKRR